MQVIRWQESALPQEQELCRRMQEEGLSPYSWSNGPGDSYAVHSHNYEKVLYCIRGSIRFTLPDMRDAGGNISAVDQAISGSQVYRAYIASCIAHIGQREADRAAYTIQYFLVVVAVHRVAIAGPIRPAIG